MLYDQRFDLNKHKKGEVEERFLSYVSHRIRTPLNSVIGFSKLLQNREVSEGKTKEFAERIMDSGYQVLQYFQNLIDLSELEAGMIKVNPSHFGINNMLSGIVGGYKDRLESEDSIDIYMMNGREEMMIYQDEFILERISTNLIELIRSNIQEGMVSIEYEEFTDEDKISLEIRGIKGQDNQSHDKNQAGSNITDSDEYDYLTWKTINRLIQLIKGQITYQSDKREVVYKVTIPGNL